MRFPIRLVVVALLVGLLTGVGTLPLSPAPGESRTVTTDGSPPPVDLAQTREDVCTSSAPDPGLYTVRLCLTTPDDGTILDGRVRVKASVEIEQGSAPPLKFLQFFFTRASEERGAAALRAFAEPFSFILPTRRWTDGAYRLDVAATFADDYRTPPVGITVTLENGITRLPVSTGRWEPSTVSSAADAPVAIAAVGDGAGGLPGSYDVADLVEGWDPDMFLYLGDVYNMGTYTEFLNHYDPTFGRFKAITNPVPGDHEGGRDFQGYLDYWNSSQHFYATTVGSWRLIALNSTERYGQITPGTRQFEWLRAQLEADDDAGCTLVFFHDARWVISSPERQEYLDDLWSLLVDEGVDIVLNGHEHRYERWQPLDASGMPNGTGPVEFVVGTGGHERNPSHRTDPRVDTAFTGDGAIRFDLRDGAADFAFITTANETIDAGTIPCQDRAATVAQGSERLDNASSVRSDEQQSVPYHAVEPLWTCKANGPTRRKRLRAICAAALAAPHTHRISTRP
jgi:hypothetical protein